MRPWDRGVRSHASLKFLSMSLLVLMVENCVDLWILFQCGEWYLGYWDTACIEGCMY